jgi:hypothetical protein
MWLEHFRLEETHFSFVMDCHGSSIGFLFMVAYIWLMDQHASGYLMVMLVASYDLC